MKKSVLLAAAALLVAAPAFAATKTYQVTGPVTEMSADTITVQKGGEKWEIAKGPANLPADLKVGSKVTVQYSMTADSVTEKPAAAKTAKPVADAAAKGLKPAMATGAPAAPSASK